MELSSCDSFFRIIILDTSERNDVEGVEEVIVMSDTSFSSKT